MSVVVGRLFIKTSRDLDQPIRSLDFERVQTCSGLNMNFGFEFLFKVDQSILFHKQGGMMERKMKWWKEG